MRRILILRPEPGATATAERARARGLEAVVMSLFETEAVAWEPPDPSRFDALLLTSANAVRHGGEGLEALRSLPVHAVGAATAEAARNAGFAIASSGDAGVDRLLGSIEPGLKLLHLCGEDRAAPAEAPQPITEVLVYRSTEKPAPKDFGVVEGSIVLVHSPRASRRFADLVDQFGRNRSSIAIAAISPLAAQAAGPGWESTEAAESPGDEALLALAARLCNKPAGT